MRYIIVAILIMGLAMPCFGGSLEDAAKTNIDIKGLMEASETAELSEFGIACGYDEFVPKKDITVYELSLILKELLDENYRGFWDFYNQKQLRRHFETHYHECPEYYR